MIVICAALTASLNLSLPESNVEQFNFWFLLYVTCLWMKTHCVTIQMKANEYNSYVVLIVFNILRYNFNNSFWTWHSWSLILMRVEKIKCTEFLGKLWCLSNPSNYALAMTVSMSLISLALLSLQRFLSNRTWLLVAVWFVCAARHVLAKFFLNCGLSHPL